MSKGSKQRPVKDRSQFDSEFDRIFNPPAKDKPKPAQPKGDRDEK